MATATHTPPPRTLTGALRYDPTADEDGFGRPIGAWTLAGWTTNWTLHEGDVTGAKRWAAQLIEETTGDTVTGWTCDADPYGEWWTPRYDIPAGTSQARAGGAFTRVNELGRPANTRDQRLRLLVDGRHIADIWACVPGGWSATGVAGYIPHDTTLVSIEDRIITAYHQIAHRADYDVHLHIDGRWQLHLAGRTGTASDDLAGLTATARHLAGSYDATHTDAIHPWTRITVTSITDPRQHVTTYTNAPLEEPVTGHPDDLTTDRPIPAAAPVTPPAAEPSAVDWSAVLPGDRLWRTDPMTGHPDALTVFALAGATVTGQLDSGPLVTVPRTDIQGVADWPASLIKQWQPIPLDQALALMETAARLAKAATDRGEAAFGLHADGSPATTHLRPGIVRTVVELERFLAGKSNPLPDLDPTARAIAEEHGHPGRPGAPSAFRMDITCATCQLPIEDCPGHPNVDGK